MNVYDKIFNYLDSLERPVELRKDHKIDATSLKQHVRHWYEKEYGVCFEEDKKTKRESLIDFFITYLIEQGCCFKGNFILGIGRVSETRMLSNFGLPTGGSSTIFCGRTKRI